ncbi:META domain-containing protein [Limibacter armeniacum]|uniref:META domain-containing protein n=1 Tax=Limibacter armeniacum TaxID=466084 RepID=UPI002FE5C113
MKRVSTIILLFLIMGCATNEKKQEQSKGENKEIVLRSTEEENTHDFIAEGHQPNWTLSIDFDKKVTFKLADGKGIETPVPSPVWAESSVTYYSEVESGKLAIIINDKQCEDTENEKVYPHNVEVKFDGKTYSGCGQHSFNYRLHDIWVLHTFEGHNEELDAAKERPRLELFPAHEKMLGQAGCNQIQGQIKARGERLAFSSITATRKSCPDIQLETAFLKALSDKEYTYEFIEGVLSLMENDKVIMTFKRTD